ncbi:hypothetical protein TWF696_003007 [Orbilia brochopaga]|uniref:Uncharacterized protein n=1 Tax=Orbilia brochopaga TaxID=3140254 RepID=A0AAV9TZ34_9PEZI
MMLRGLHPGTIAYIADQATQVWVWQAWQELQWGQWFVEEAKNEKMQLFAEYERAINEEKSKAQALEAQLNALADKNSELVLKNNELGQSCREKAAKYKRLQADMDKLKRKNIVSITQGAAAAAIDLVVNQPQRTPPGSSSGVARLSETNAVHTAPMGDVQLAFGEGGRQGPSPEDSTVANQIRHFGHRNGAFGNGNNHNGRGSGLLLNSRGSTRVHPNERTGNIRHTGFHAAALGNTISTTFPYAQIHSRRASP